MSFAVLLVAISALIVWSFIESPKHPQLRHFGDDAEYLLTTQSFVEHGSPDFRAGDARATLDTMPPKLRWAAKHKYRPPAPSGYYASKRGQLFCWHFFTYAAAVAPLKAALDRQGLGPRAFHYANILFLCIALLSLLQFWRRPALAFVLLALTFMTPVLWFLPLPHTEPFVFSLGVLAFACHLNGRRLLAVLFAALGATQFQPLAVVAFYLAADTLWSYGGRRVDRAMFLQNKWRCLACLTLAAIALVPALFYGYHFGTASLVTREGLASTKLMSVQKLDSMFVDLDTGMLVYLPGVLFLFAVSCGLAARRSWRERTIAPLLPALTVLLALWISTSARIWNYHTQGISRYALYIAPAMLLTIALEWREVTKPRALALLTLMAAVCLQVVVHDELGWFDYRGNNNLHHNAAALFVLERWPSWYVPPPEIFCSRTLHRRCVVDLDTGFVTPEYLPVIFRDHAGVPVKALVDPCSLTAPLAAATWTPVQVARIEATATACKVRGPQYVNFR